MQHAGPRNPQRFSSVEEEVSSALNQQPPSVRPSQSRSLQYENGRQSMRPVTPTTSAVCFNNRGPMYTMRRNFSTGGNGQHRGPYSKRTRPKTPAVAKGPFFRDVVLLAGPNSDSVPRQTNKVWLSENGHILTACCLQKEWTAEEVAHNLRSLFGRDG